MRLSATDTPVNRIASVDREITGYTPITLTEAKSWGRIKWDAEDQDIDFVVGAVVEDAERYCNTSFVSSNVEVVFSSYGDKIPLPYGPIDEIQGVYEMRGIHETEVDSDNYYLRGERLVLPGRWSMHGDLKVVYKTKPDMSLTARLAMKKAIVTHFEDRQDNYEGGFGLLPQSSCKMFQRIKRR